jgi:hypothetical protein
MEDFNLKKAKERLLKEELKGGIYGNPINKEALKSDVESSINDMKKISPTVEFDRSISRFASGSKSELYINVYFSDSKEEENFLKSLKSKYPIVGVTGGLSREVYQDKNNNVHFRIVRINNNESSIIFNRKMPKGR